MPSRCEEASRFSQSEQNAVWCGRTGRTRNEPHCFILTPAAPQTEETAGAGGAVSALTSEFKCLYIMPINAGMAVLMIKNKEKKKKDYKLAGLRNF